MEIKDIYKLIVDEIYTSGMPVCQIAKKSGIGESTIRSWLSTKCVPSVENAQMVLAVLGKELHIREITTNEQEENCAV